MAFLSTESRTISPKGNYRLPESQQVKSSKYFDSFQVREHNFRVKHFQCQKSLNDPSNFLHVLVSATDDSIKIDKLAWRH